LVSQKETCEYHLTASFAQRTECLKILGETSRHFTYLSIGRRRTPLFCAAFLYLLAMKNTYIKLLRGHIPIHPKMLLKNQKDYEFYMEVLLFLNKQLLLGVEPKYMVTMHYQHPSELCKPFKETNKPFGFGDRYGFKTKHNIWKEVPLYKYWEKRRNDLRQVLIDTQKVKCRIMKKLYGVKRMDRPDKYEFPNLLFFHEKGKTKLQYHTHILLPSRNLISNDIVELLDIFNTSIRKGTECISKWKRIDITEVETPNNIMSYLNKETSATHTPFDFYNSNPIIPRGRTNDQ